MRKTDIEKRIKALQMKGFYVQIACLPNNYKRPYYDLFIIRWDDSRFGVSEWHKGETGFKTLNIVIDKAEGWAAEYEKECPIAGAKTTLSTTTYNTESGASQDA